MQIRSKSGRLIGVSDPKDPNKITLLNPEEPIRIKVEDASRMENCWFSYEIPEKRFSGFVPVKHIIDTGNIVDGEYVYNIVHKG